jgi:hypothetical protein
VRYAERAHWVNGRAGDTLTLEETGGFDTSGVVRGTQAITLAPGSMSLAQSDSASGTTGGVPWGSTLNRTSQISFSGVSALKIDGSGQKTSLRVNDQAGNLPLSPTGVPGSLSYTMTSQEVGRLAGTSLTTVGYQGVGALELDGSVVPGPAKAIDVQSSAAGTPVTVNAGPGTAISVGGAADSLTGLLGPVTVNSGRRQRHLQQPGGRGAQLRAQQQRLRPADRREPPGRPPLVWFTGVPTVVLNTGSGTAASYTWLQGVAAGSGVTVNSGPGYIIAVTSTASTLDDFLGPLTVHG